MSTINKYVLDEVDAYKNFMFNNCSCLSQFILNSPQYINFELLSSLNNLFYIVIENVRMDLNYLVTIDPDLDTMGFPALNRNLRSTIEAFYDLYNLSLNSDYLCILKHNSKVIEVEQTIPTKYKENKISKPRFYTLKDKANIAIKINKFEAHNYKLLSELSINANASVHNDIFNSPSTNKEKILFDLLKADCYIIYEAYHSIYNFLNIKYNITYEFDPKIAYNQLLSRISKISIII